MKLMPQFDIRLDVAPTSLAFSPDGQFLLAGGFESDQVHVYAINDDVPKLVKTLPMRWASCPPHTIQWLNGRIYAVGNGGEVCYIWNDQNFKVERTVDMSAELSRIKSISVIGDKLLIAGETKYGDEDKPDIYIMNVASGKILSSFCSGCFIDKATWNGETVWIAYNDFTNGSGADAAFMVKQIATADIEETRFIKIASGEVRDIHISHLNNKCYVSANSTNTITEAVLADVGNWVDVLPEENIASFTVADQELVLFLDVFNGNHFEIRNYQDQGKKFAKLFLNRHSSSSLGMAYKNHILACSRDNHVLVFNVQA